MNLITPRLRLRDLAITDLEAVHELLCIPETDEFNTMGLPENIAATRAILEGWLEQHQQQPAANYIRVMEQLSDGRFVGLIAMIGNKAPKYKRAEIWYKIHKELFGLGYTTEAMKAILHFAFVTLGLHRVEAGCAVDHIASRRVMEKSGMQLEGRSRKILPIRGQWVDAFKYAILDTDYFEQQEQLVS